MDLQEGNQVKNILIPDEYILDYSLSRVEGKRRYEEHSKSSEKAFKEMDKMIEKIKKAKKSKI